MSSAVRLASPDSACEYTPKGNGDKVFALHEVLDSNGNRIQFDAKERTPLFNEGGPLAENTASKDTAGRVPYKTIPEPGEDVKHSRPVRERNEGESSTI